MSKMNEDVYKNKRALPNKILNEDGSVTDLLGNSVIPTDEAYKKIPALPNKVLNPDGTYSTLSEIIGGSAGKDLFIIVDELPAEGEPNKIYLVPDGEGGFDEYHYVDGKWDPIGTMGSNIPAQVYYWDGNTQQAGIDFWQNIIEVNKESVIMVNGKSVMDGTVTFNVFTIIEKGKLYQRLVKYGSASVLFSYQMNSIHQTSYSMLRDNLPEVKLIDSDKEGIIKQITYNTSSQTYNRASYLSVNQNYPTPYVPQYPGSPATKKYVDDSIASAITDAMGGEY